MTKKPPLGSGERFKRLTEQLKRKGSRTPRLWRPGLAVGSMASPSMS